MPHEGTHKSTLIPQSQCPVPFWSAGMYRSHWHKLPAVCAHVCMGVVSTPEGRNYSMYLSSHLPWDLAQLWRVNESLNTGGLSDSKINNPIYGLSRSQNQGIAES